MDLLEHFAGVRAPHGREQCECCEGDGAHGSRACQRCAGTGFVRQGSDEPWCAPREGDQPAKPRRHWRQASIRMAPPEEYSRYIYPDYPRARSPATLARYLRKHEPDYYAALHAHVGEHGVQEPVLLRYRDPRGTELKRPVVMSGHHRAAAAFEHGQDIPVGDYDDPGDYDTGMSDFGQRWWAQHHELKEQYTDPRRHEGALAGHPEYGPEPQYDSEAYQRDPAYHRDYMDRKRAWGTQVKRGLSLGHLSPGEAKGLGYYFGGHETDSYGEPRWQALPKEMYHATTDLPSVRQHGLKTRDELAQGRAHGLGGGESDTISVTTDHQLGRHILGALHEYHRVVNGRYTPQQMWEDARAGKGASRPFHEDLAMFWEHGWKDRDELPRGLHNALHAVHRESTLGTSQEQMDAEKGPGWRPAHDDEGWMSGHKPPRKMHGWWERDMDPDEARDNAADFYSKFSAMREHAGGPEDPLFFGTDTKAFAAKDPKHFALLHVRPRPEGHGYPMGGMREWRTGTGDALEVHHYEQQHDQGQLHEAGRHDYRLMHTAPDRRSGRPYHEYHGLDPDEPVTIYRSVPHNVSTIHHGDWVTTDPDYAHRHGRHPHDPAQDWPVLQADVAAKHLYWDENDENELGYQGPHLGQRDVGYHREEGADEPEEDYRPARRRSFWDTDYAGSHHFGAAVPPAERTERTDHILEHYAPTDFGTWAEVRDNINWDDPGVRAFTEDVRQNGVRRPIPVDYESSPPRVMNGHMRLLAAERTGTQTVPTRQHEGWMDPDDPDHLGRGPDDPEHWTNRWEREGSRFPYSHLKVHTGAAQEPSGSVAPLRMFAWAPGHVRTAADMYHGSDNPEPFERFDFSKRSLRHQEEEDYARSIGEEPVQSRWWNSRLGSHFTSEHSMAAEAARSHGNGRTYHVDVRLENPKDYASEHDLAREGFEWARRTGYKGLIAYRDDPDAYADPLQQHPKAQEIADGFRRHLQDQGHDGITYGNEYEQPIGHKCAIIFRPDQAHITHAHSAYEGCSEASRCPHCGHVQENADWGKYKGCESCGEPVGGHEAALQHEAGQRGELPGLEYYHVLQGREKGGFHALVAAHEGTVIGHLSWGPSSTRIGQLWVHPDYRRHGVADAIYQRAQWVEPGLSHHPDRTDAGEAWARSVSPDPPERLHDTTEDPEHKGAWAARQFQERLDSGHRTMKRLAVLPLRNPHTRGHEWYHGTMAHPEELGEHGFMDPMSMATGAYEQPEDEAEGGHWNSMLGVHFTADHDVARAFAQGEHSSGANERIGDWEGGEYTEPHRGIVHARLGLKNPKVYDSEHDMDHEAYEHEHAAGNHPSNHVPGIGRAAGEGDEDEEYEAEEMWHHAHQIAKDYGHDKIPASTYGHFHTPFQGHPMRTAWLNTHPDKWGIANRFRERLQAAGHDGVIYGNEYEKSRRGREANKSAIVFDPDQIHVTQHHHVDETCDPEPMEHEAGRDISRIRLKHEPPIISGHWERDEQGVPTHWVDTDPAQGHHMLTALAPNNRTVGWMHWDKGVVRKIDVNENWQRSGLGRRMWERASEITPGLSHSDNRTEQGQAFAQSVGGPLPERVQDHPEWFREAAWVRLAALGPLYHQTQFEEGFPYDEWSHIGTRRAAVRRAQEVHPQDYGFPADHPTTLHQVRLHGRVYPHVLTNEQADEVWGAGHVNGLEEDGLPSGQGYHVFPYHDNAEDGGISYLVHRSAIEHVGTETIPRHELPHRHEAVFTPTERIFGPTYGLDHRLFGESEHLLPAVRDAIMARLGGVLDHALGPDWHLLVTAWLAGSQVSKWTGPDLEGNGDLDVLIGLSHSHARQASPELAQMTDEQIEHHLNHVLREEFNAPGWHPPFDPGGTYDLTGYAIHAADIREIQPYAAYDLSDDRWTVRPPDLPQWSAEQFPQGPALMQQARALIAEVRAILRLPEPFRRQEAERIWHYIHEGRAQAFSPGGLGWQGTGNVLEKALDQASGFLVEKLKSVIYGSAEHSPVALGHGMTTDDLAGARA